MSNANLPERPSLEYLKKLAKDRLQDLRRTDPTTKLAAAQLAVARELGFPSWRALKAEVERRSSDDGTLFFEACTSGDVEALRALLQKNPSLVRTANSRARHGNWTGLHTAAQAGHVDAVKLLLQHGADPNAREAGDNTYPIHWAAAGGHLEIVRALLDAGGDVHGIGDVHELDVIGWATVYRPPGDVPSDVMALLTERGARHHIYSAIATGDAALVRALVERDASALDRRMSRFENGQTPLHFAISRGQYDMLPLLVELGVDLEAPDDHGQTAMASAMLRGDREAMRHLHAGGANVPVPAGPMNVASGMAALAGSVRKIVPMLSVPDIAKTLDWYTSIGFTEVGRYADGGVVNWGMVAFGRVQVMFNLYGVPGANGVSLWFYTERVDEFYQLLKNRQLAAASAVLAGTRADHLTIEFAEDLYDPFYGGRQFSIRDPNGYSLIFLQEGEPGAV
jgi:ankyrin repeat protein/catechol 2,3-dioxygenase-like lactoylglutathione lyase family enzyme